MAKFYGVIGYAVTKETAPGVWTEEITEQSYYGDLTRNMRRLQDSGDLNDDINVANEISIVADPYLRCVLSIQGASFHQSGSRPSGLRDVYGRLVCNR